MNNITIKGLALLLIQFMFINCAYSASCKGPHANDPGCATAPATLSPVIINRVWADWLNERIFVEGANFSGSTSVTIAGAPVTISAQTPTQLEIPFTPLPKGNHNLVASDSSSASTASLSFYAKGEMVDSNLTGCPCATGWENMLSTPVNSVQLWNLKVTSCYELSPGGPGNPVDISGTVLSNSSDPSVYPQYPIGAAFTEDPNESVCQLTEVNQSAVTDLVKIRINRQQQGDCRQVLADHICSSTIIEIP